MQTGGQRKIVGIICARISNKQILILDEPTSGLDEFSSVKLMEKLHRLAVVDGKTVLISIHKASQEELTNIDH